MAAVSTWDSGVVKAANGRIRLMGGGSRIE